jgi:hypothetical protein
MFEPASGINFLSIRCAVANMQRFAGQDRDQMVRRTAGFGTTFHRAIRSQAAPTNAGCADATFE